jgi:regulator of ribonuclease activity A
MVVPATSDLADEFGDRLDSCDIQLNQYGGVRSFEGEIVTFRSDEDNLVLKSLVSSPGHGKVLVVDCGGSVHAAMLGDNMASRAAENGWRGIIVHGAVRDVGALARIPLGVKALGSNPRRSKKDGRGEQNVTVRFGGATFEPGRHLVSDDDGLIVLPPDA